IEILTQQTQQMFLNNATIAFTLFVQVTLESSKPTKSGQQNFTCYRCGEKAQYNSPPSNRPKNVGYIETEKEAKLKQSESQKEKALRTKA
ncbi:44604_t:CDS:2, partial [Gigaspora margarita]